VNLSSRESNCLFCTSLHHDFFHLFTRHTSPFWLRARLLLLVEPV
jgi:hypothetical protein